VLVGEAEIMKKEKKLKKINVRYIGNLHFRFGCAKHLLWSFGLTSSGK